MAYRNFRYEKTFEAPDLSAIDRTAAAIGSILATAGKRKQAQKNAANQFNYDLDKGAYESDTYILGDIAKQVTTRARDELRNYGRMSLDTEKMMKDGLAAQQASQNQMKRAQELNAAITSKADKYYNPQPDIDLVRWATHGENNDIDYRTRGERLAQAEQRIGGIETFKFDDYAADYVKKVGQQSKSQEFPLKSGGSKTIFDEASFWNQETGKPGVTDGAAIKFLDSEERVREYYDNKINKELTDEIKSMKASGDTRVAWMKGMSDVDIKNALINDPSKNLINDKDFGVRIREKAKVDLEERDRINSKISYTGLQADTNGSGGRWKNPNILHSDSINSFAQEARDVTTGKSGAVTTYGPGGRFTQKNGRALQVDTTNPVRTDTNRGITTRNNKGSVRLNMTGYQLMPVSSGMAPFVLKAPDPQGMIEEIQNMPLENFDPEGKVKLQPEMKIGLNGYTVNEAGVLNDIQDQLMNLSTQMHEAQKSGDKEKIGNIENMEFQLNELKEMVGSGDYDPRDLLLAGNKAGVRKIQQEWIIPADNSDIATIKNVTGGFDLRDKSYWNEDMKAVDAAYRARAEEAKAKNYGKEVGPVVTSDGSDTEKWKFDTQYKVGKAIYYYDKPSKQWKKK